MALSLPKSIDPFQAQLDQNLNNYSQGKTDIDKKTDAMRAPVEKNIENINSEDLKTLQNKQSAQQQAVTTEEANAKFAQDNVSKPLNLPEFKPEPIDNQKMQAFGGILAAFAAIGGRHTRTSALSAGNALAGALTGYKEGNQLKFENDYKKYKADFDKSVKQHEENINYVKDLLAAKNMDLSAKLRRIELYATDHQLYTVKLAAEQHNLDKVNKEVDKMEKSLDVTQKNGLEALKTLDSHQQRIYQHDIEREKLNEQRSFHGATKEHWVKQDLAKAAKAENVKLTVAEEKATANYASMENADPRIDALVKKGVTLPAYTEVKEDDNGFISVYGAYGRNISLSDDQQALLQSIRQFSEGAGHLKSGARINKQTMDIMRDLYAPIGSDSDKTKQLKSESRKNDLLAARVAGGKGVDLYNKLKKGESTGLAEPDENDDVYQKADDILGL